MSLEVGEDRVLSTTHLDQEYHVAFRQRIGPVFRYFHLVENSAVIVYLFSVSSIKFTYTNNVINESKKLHILIFHALKYLCFSFFKY